MIDFFKNFISRKGHLIYGSTIISKVSGFLITVFAVRLISKEEFGLITYARTILFFISPFLGLGLMNSLLRYGSIAKSQYEKKNYYLYALKFGGLFSLVLTFLLIVFSGLITTNLPDASWYLIVLSLSLLTLSYYNMFLSYLRINNLNETYSQINVKFSIVSLFLSLTLTFLFKGTGFALAIVFTPLLVFIVSNFKKLHGYYRLLVNISFDWKNNFTFIRYGILVGIGSIASQITLMTDNLLIGNILKDADSLALYRVGSLIPLNLFFVSSVFMTTDFVKLASESKNSFFLKNYYLNYLKFFLIVSLLLIGGIYVFSDFLVNTIFGAEYESATPLLRLLLIGVVGSFLLRIPMGNILNAVGKAKWNTYNAYFMLVFNLLLSAFLIINHGLYGAAIATAVTLWVSGFIGLGMFLYYLRNI